MYSSFAYRSSLSEFIADHASAFPGKPAVIFPKDTASGEDSVLTYGRLAQHAGALADWLRSRLRPGDRVMLALPTGPDFVAAFVACLYAGMVAVPVPVPDGFSNALRRTAGIAADCGTELVLATGHDLPAVAEWADVHGLDHVTCAPVPRPDQLPAGDHLLGGGPSADSLAFLQYTSGSTGEPKGVMVTHRSLMANIELCRAGIGFDSSTVFGGWVPLYHDMGLIVLLCMPLRNGTTTVLMSATAFLRHPVEWLRVIDRYGIGISPAPNFAYDLCNRVITDEQIATLDLSRWRFAINGAEPVHAPTMAAFAAKFAAAGLTPAAFVPSYGMAEATVYVSTKPPATRPVVLSVEAGPADRGRLVAAPGDRRSLVSCGFPRGFELRIVDPATREVLPDARIGEIWLRGPSVTRGYWGRAAATAATVAAVTAAREPGWLRTGDLGAVHDGELYVTGRLKEMLIVHGRNLFPQDLEHEAKAAHPALTGLVGAAFGVAAPDERPVLVHEVNLRAARAQLPSVAAAIKTRLTRAFAIPAGNVILVRRGAVRRTTSGKIERATMRQLFLDGHLHAVHADLEPAVARLLPEPPLAPAGTAAGTAAAGVAR
jgi:acyl-CoA synthetase (AMP-forming)/AMP-acid ligase II